MRSGSDNHVDITTIRNPQSMFGPANRGWEGGMGSRCAGTVQASRWPVLLLLAFASFWWSIPSARGEAVDGGSGRQGEGDGAAAAAGGVGRGRLLLSFQESRGNSSFRCSPSGPCLPCQYSEKNDNKYRCSETGYRVPLKCIHIKDSIEEAKKVNARRKLFYLQENALTMQKQLFTTLNNYKWRKLLAATNGEESYITYRSCIPVDSQEKLSVLGFEVIMIGLLLISGSVVYLRQKRTAVMSGVAPTRIPTSAPRF
ncbi:hypothetical protein Cni_G14369 [Canna indica]|uniref:Uncharacterized protein n=1 Tax=Canna indica TaxID=4628 RepID=A0AAQ3QEP3_9LILI|nr:hypothetical protein Cni_G14369 [Canna indica]